jgi:single-strand DNA-binding protein
MAKGLNKVQIIGYLGAAPELRKTQADKSVAGFSVGVTAYPAKETEWFRCVAWEKQAETLAQADKGALVYIEGRLQTKEFTDRDNNTRKYQEVVVRDFLFLNSRQASAMTQAADDNDSGAGNLDDFDADELPF